MIAMISRRAALVAVTASLALLSTSAYAADKLRIGKAVQQNFGNLPLEVGIKYGIFTKEGLEIESLNFTGGARTAQAIVSDSIDIALSAGPDMAFTHKGAPQIAVATISDSTAFMSFAVAAQSTARGINDMKGKKIGVTSPGSLTAWMVDELNRVKGWTSEQDRAVAVAVGGAPPTAFAALKTGQVDAYIGGLQVGYQLEARGEGRTLFLLPEYVKSLELFVAFASNASLQRNPDAVRRFLKGWFESVDYMKAHKAESVATAAEVLGFPAEIASRMYDELKPAFSTDGRLRKEPLDKLFESFVELGTLDKSVDITKLYTEQYLPKR